MAMSEKKTKDYSAYSIPSLLTKVKYLQDEVAERERQISVYKQEVIAARARGREEAMVEIQRIKAQILDKLFGL